MHPLASVTVKSIIFGPMLSYKKVVFGEFEPAAPKVPEPEVVH